MSIREEDKRKFIQILTNPEEHGYKKCESCKGYGGDNRKINGIPHELCEDCGGDGVIPIPVDTETDGTTCSILEEMGVTPVLDESGFSSGVGIVEKKS